MGAAFSPSCRLYPPACKPYGLAAEPEAGRDAVGVPPDGAAYRETLEKCSILVKFKEGDNFNGRRPAGSALGVNTLSISRIKI